jgi:hypothetical protein
LPQNLHGSESGTLTIILPVTCNCVGDLWVIGGFLGFIPHHAWFQYYAAANPNHARPASVRKSVVPTRPTISATWGLL